MWKNKNASKKKTGSKDVWLIFFSVNSRKRRRFIFYVNIKKYDNILILGNFNS